MRKYIQLSIPEPCHEDWNKMTNVDKGKFCGACQKNVIDFTGMSDEQLIAFFRKPTTGSTCGRFMGEQLERSIEIPGKRIPWVKYFFQFALPAFLVTAKAKAQIQGKVLGTPVVTIPICDKEKVGEISMVSLIKVFKGQVIDEDGQGIPYATVKVSDKSAMAITDSAGKFSIQVLTDLTPDLHLQVSSVGFEMKKILPDELKKVGQDKELSIQLNRQVKNLDEVVVNANVLQHYLGGLAGGVIIRRSSYIDTVKNWLWPEKEVASIYPNPVQRGASLKIKLDLKKKSEYSLNIVNSEGSTVFTKKIFINSKNQIEDVPVTAAFASGTYFVSVLDKRKKVVYSGKVIVF